MNSPAAARTALLVALALALALAGGAAAQQPESYGFGEVVDVVLVNVEAWVTDGKGTPVTGLAATDFEVLEDGRPVAITHFAEVQQSRLVVSEIDRTLADPVLAEAPIRAAVDPNHLVIYFDQLHLRPASRNRLIDELRDFLVDQRVPPERVLVLRQDREMITELSFGASWSELDDALARVTDSSPLGGSTASLKRLTVRSLQDLWKRARDIAASRPVASASNDEAACEFFMPRAVAEVQLYMRQTRDRISLTLDHLTSAASFLAGVPGVKYLLYVSDQLEREPAADLAAFINRLCPTRQDSRLFVLGDELSLDFDRLTRHANANRVTIYALQASGLEAMVLAGASQSSVDLRAATSFEQALRRNESEGLKILAAETGGRAVLNRNELGGELAEIGREMGSYYTLAYEPPHGGDEGDHRIEVRLKNADLRVRHRRGYRDKNPDERMTERLQGAMYLGLVDNELGVRLGAGRVEEGKGRGLVVPLHVMLPAARLAFLPSAEAAMASVSLQISTLDTKTQRGIFASRSFRVRQPSGGQEVVDLVLDLVLPPGVHVVAVGVRDDATREAAFVSTTLDLQAGGRRAAGP